MASNYIGPQDTVDYTAGADIDSGAVVNINGTLGIALGAIANGATGAVAITGAYRVPKAAGFVAAFGDRLMWDASEGDFAAEGATPASGDVSGGVMVVEAAASADTTVGVKLLPGSGTET